MGKKWAVVLLIGIYTAAMGIAVLTTMRIRERRLRRELVMLLALRRVVDANAIRR